MLKFVTTAKRALWEFVELGFLLVLALVLIFLLLGQSAGPYVVSVADNVTKFATGASAGMLGIVIGAGDRLSRHAPDEMGRGRERAADAAALTKRRRDRKGQSAPAGGAARSRLRIPLRRSGGPGRLCLSASAAIRRPGTSRG